MGAPAGGELVAPWLLRHTLLPLGAGEAGACWWDAAALLTRLYWYDGYA